MVVLTKTSISLVSWPTKIQYLADIPTRCLTDIPTRVLRYALIVLLAAFSSAASCSVSLLNYTLRDLTSNTTTVDLTQFQGTPVMFIFFEPDCPWCFKQVKTTNQLWSNCSATFQPIAVGVHGNRTQLKKETRRLRAHFPTLQASPELIKEFGDIPGTPLILFADTNGQYSGHYRGYHNTERLTALLSKQAIVCADSIAE